MRRPFAYEWLLWRLATRVFRRASRRSSWLHNAIARQALRVMRNVELRARGRA